MLQYSDDGKFLAAVTTNGSVNLYRKGSEAPLLLPSYLSHPYGSRVSFSSDSKIIGVSGSGMTGSGVRLWSTHYGEFVQLLQSPMVEPNASSPGAASPARTPRYMQDIAFSADNDRVISIDNLGQICTWKRKSAELLQQAPKSLMTSYNAWKKAHAAPKADALLAFYTPKTRFDGILKEYDYDKFREFLLRSQTNNWKNLTDRQPPRITKSDQGWVMHCSLDYKDGWGFKQAHGWRRMVWAQSRGALRIIEDEVVNYTSTQPVTTISSSAGSPRLAP
jgi:hypothetical protein